MREEFDPGAAAEPDSGLFGLGTGPDESLVHLIPVPYEATTSYRGGTSKGPQAIVEASVQVDLYDIDTGRPYEAGICMLEASDEIAALNAEAESGADIDAVNRAGSRVNEIVREQAETALAAGKLVGVVGGDHASPFGLIEALAARHPGMGILHIDAHHDLRVAYEGYVWSHASIMYNAVDRIPDLGRIVQVGIRDFSEEEAEFARRSDRGVVTYYDQEIRKALFQGRPWQDVAHTIISQLPEKVYVSFDIDGLDPKLCPNTGTPVPGGLDFEEALHILRLIVESGREIVGFDLCEVAPGEDEWDANVGARVLYKLIGFSLLSQARN